MNYQECPHYDEIFKNLSEGRDLEDISFEIDEIRNCKECSKTEGVCTLWLFTFTEPQMSISDAKVVIHTLNKIMGN